MVEMAESRYDDRNISFLLSTPHPLPLIPAWAVHREGYMVFYSGENCFQKNSILLRHCLDQLELFGLSSTNT